MTGFNMTLMSYKNRSLYNYKTNYWHNHRTLYLVMKVQGTNKE